MTRKKPIATFAAALLAGACSQAPGNDTASAPAANAAAVAGPAAPTANGPLAVYVGKDPLDPVDGLAFLDHERVQAAVEVAVRNEAPRMWVFRRDARRTPIALKDGRLLSHGCDPANCSGRNWTIVIDTLGAIAEICYRDSSRAGGRAQTWRAGSAPVPHDGDCPVQ